MPIGLTRAVITSPYIIGGGGGITSTTAFTLSDAITGTDSTFYGQMDWQGVFNTDYGVFVSTYLNQARSSYNLIPGVINLTTGAIAMGTPVAVGAGYSGAATVTAVSAAPGTNYGLVGGPIWTGSTWSGKYYGYTLSGTSTATTSSIPTITMSSPLTETVSSNFYSGHMNYAGNNRFVYVNRFGPGDLAMSHYITYAGSGTPTKFNANTTNYGPDRSTGYTISFTSGIPANTANSFTNLSGNNGNWGSLYVTSASSSAEAQYANATRLDAGPAAPISGGGFTCAKAWDSSGTWIGVSGLYSTAGGQKLVAEKVTSLSTSSITVTSGSVLSPTYRVAFIDQLDPTAGTARSALINGSGTWFSDISVNSSTLAVTQGTPYQVNAANTFYNLKTLVDPTHGDWNMLARYQGANKHEFCFVKVV